MATLLVTVPAVATGAGKVVWRLKEREGKVGGLAGKLVNRWKKMCCNMNLSPAPLMLVRQ